RQFHLLGMAARHRARGRDSAARHYAEQGYAELEWPIDLLIAVVWVAYAVVFFGTLAMRKVQHIYVANWFFAAYIITIAVLHIINNLAIPVSLTKSYGIYSGVVDAMVEWWY